MAEKKRRWKNKKRFVSRVCVWLSRREKRDERGCRGGEESFFASVSELELAKKTNAKNEKKQSRRKKKRKLKKPT